MRLKEEQKAMAIGILLVFSIVLQILSNYLADDNAGYYQHIQEENISILKRYSKINNLGLIYINLNSKISGLFGWRQGDKPLGEAQVKTVSLYRGLTREDQQKWGEKTLLEYYYNEGHQIAIEINKNYSDLAKQVKILEQETTNYATLIKSNNWWRRIVVFINLSILVICMLLYYNILTGIIMRLKK